MKKSTLIIVLSMLPTLAFTQDAANYQCALDEVTRRVVILSEPGVAVPCEVHYYKDTESPGEDQVLWAAQNEAGYCEARAAEFVERLRSMGWTCWDAGSGDGEPPTDDTEALAPAEEEIEIPESDPPQD
jgi:hypothetical protein